MHDEANDAWMLSSAVGAQQWHENSIVYLAHIAVDDRTRHRCDTGTVRRICDESLFQIFVSAHAEIYE